MSKQQDLASECFRCDFDIKRSASNLRSALVLAERGKASYGSIRCTNATATRTVRGASTFAPESDRPGVRPFAAWRRTRGDGKVRGFRAVLTGTDAEPSRQRFGFTMGR